jgi:hypothetical protein
VSSLWTPGGEHRVGRTDPAAPDPTAPAEHTEYVGGDIGGPEELDEAALRAEIDRARARVAEAPPEVVVLNHAMGLYELGAIHLSAAPPNLDAAALAIDAFGYLVEGLGDRLGPDVSTLRDALAQIRLAFVQIKGAGVTPDAEAPGSPEPPAPSEPPAG